MLKRAALLGFLLAASTGCGGGAGSVTGTVTLDDQPLGGAAVSVSAANGEVFAAFSQPDGTYTVPDVPAGPCRVCVNFTEQDEASRDLDVKRGTKTAGKVGRKLPEEFTDPDKSGLKVTVTAGQPASLNITMKTK